MHLFELTPYKQIVYMPRAIKSYIEQAYSDIDFKLTTTKTSEVFTNVIAREFWIGSFCLAIRADLLQ